VLPPSDEWQPRCIGPGRSVLLVSAAALAIAMIAILAAAAVLRAVPAATPSVRTVPLPHGASRVEAGVPVGYERTAAGAVDAATNYAVALNGQMLLHPDQVRAAEALMAAPSHRSGLMAAGEASLRALNSSFGLAANAAHGVQVVIRLVPIAFHLDSYDGQQAAVSIWAVWVLAEAGLLAPQQHWLTATFLLEWTTGDWKVSGTSTRPGPVPAPPQETVPDQSSPLPAVLTEFKEYQHVAS
jgi:hypothetical protein